MYIIKIDENDKLSKYKTRLVVNGFGQKKGINFDQIISHVVKMISIHIILDLLASMDLELQQLDVKNAFSHGDKEGELYMKQKVFEVKGNKHMLWKLEASAKEMV